MSLYAFIELPSPLDTWVATPDVLFPMRSQFAAELQSSDAPDPEQILLELERYVDENPDKLSRFSEAGGQLAFRTAVELSINGLKEEALQFYELSLRLRPGDVITRLNYAIALHELAYRAEALKQYNLLMEQTSPSEHLRVWILAAQIHFYHGEYAEVVHLLEPLAEKYFPDDAQFWELLGEAGAQALGASEALQMVSADGADMGDFDLYELKPELLGQWHLPTTPIPVRRERQHEVFPQGGPVDIHAMLEEMCVFLEQHPALKDLYNPLIALLAYLAGMSAAADGRHEQALQIYEMGLAAEPGNIGLRSHYALALHCLGRDNEAKSWMEQIVADPPQGTILPMLWMLLAKLYAHDGEYAKALALLEDLDKVAHVEKGLQAFLAQMQEKAAEPAIQAQPSASRPEASAVRTSASTTNLAIPAKSRVTTYIVIGVLAALLAAVVAYVAWPEKKGGDEQPGSDAKKPLELILPQKFDEETQQEITAAEQLRLKEEADRVAAEKAAMDLAAKAFAEKAKQEQKASAAKTPRLSKPKPSQPVQPPKVRQPAVAATPSASSSTQENTTTPIPAANGYTAKFKGAFGRVVAKRTYPTKEMKNRALDLWKKDGTLLEPDGSVTKPQSSVNSESSRIPGH